MTQPTPERRWSIWQIPESLEKTHLSGTDFRMLRPSPIASRVLLSGVGIAIAAPVLMHLIPTQGAGLGPRLLPLFYAPLVAALVFNLPLAIAVSALAPLGNHLLTDLPPTALLPRLVLQIGIFVLVIRLLHRRNWLLVGPAAYVASLATTATIIWIIRASPPVDVGDTLQTGWPGIIAIGAIGIVAQKALR